MEAWSSNTKWHTQAFWLQRVCLESPSLLIFLDNYDIPPSSVRWEALWQDSGWEAASIRPPQAAAAPSPESSNYLSPSLPTLPLPLTLPMIRKPRSSLKSISPSYWHKLKLAVARAVNSVGSQLIIFVNWKIDFFSISTICTFQTFLLTLSLLSYASTENNWKQRSQCFPFIWPLRFS